MATQLASRGYVLGPEPRPAGSVTQMPSVSLKVYSAFFPPADAAAAEHVGRLLNLKLAGVKRNPPFQCWTGPLPWMIVSTVHLPDELVDRLAAEAARRGISVDELAAEASRGAPSPGADLRGCS